MQSNDYVYKVVDGLEVFVSAYWVKGKGPKGNEPYGIALGFHGGGFVIGSRYFLPMAEIEYLANAGFVVVSADYRLCPQVSLFDGPIRDAMDAFAWCKSELPGKLETDAGIEIDSSQIVAWGQSAGALMALYLGGLQDPPRAILDMYGAKYLTNDFWYTPLPALAMLPPFEKAYLDQIWEEPVIATTTTSLEKEASALASTPKTKGLPVPDFSIPRNAWLFDSLKSGTHLKAIVKDDKFERTDPVRLFSSSFPPTFFIHGTADTLILTEFSEKAHGELAKLGVDTGIALVEGQSHGFDAGISTEDVEWAKVRESLDFLIYHRKS